MRIDVARLHGRIGHIALNQFLDPAIVMPVFNDAINSFMNADGIIIDVHGNPGGQAEMIAGMAGWFIRESGCGDLPECQLRIRVIVPLDTA